MDILIIIVLIVAAVILFLVELFVIPGISIAGILAGACMIYEMSLPSLPAAACRLHQNNPIHEAEDLPLLLPPV